MKYEMEGRAVKGFLSLEFKEVPSDNPGFSVPRVGESIIEWRDADGNVVGKLVVGDDGTARMEYPA